MIIYVIYHIGFGFSNIFTTNKNKIPELLNRQLAKYKETDETEWKYRILEEEEEFLADMTLIKF